MKTYFITNQKKEQFVSIDLVSVREAAMAAHRILAFIGQIIFALFMF